MADKRISELTELGDIASNDFIPLVDTSVNETKKVSAETLSNFVQNNIVIPPSTTNEIEQGNSSVEVIDTGTDGRVVVTADGSEIARFTAAGVAIGTDTLDAEDFLKVFDPATGQFVFGDGFEYGAPVLQIRSNNEDAGDAHLWLATPDGGGEGFITARDADDRFNMGSYGASLTFDISFSEKMRIDPTSGGLLIGTTTNPSDYKLVVSGITYASNYDVALTTAGSNTVALDFSGGTGLYTRSASGTVTFTASNYRAGAIKTVRVIAGGSSRTLIFPTNWVFVGAKPACIASGKTGILTVTSFGTTEADCVAAWAVQT